MIRRSLLEQLCHEGPRDSRVTELLYIREPSSGGGGGGITGLTQNVLAAGPGVVPAITRDIMIPAADADAVVGVYTSTVYFSGLSATHTATLPPVPTDGQTVTVKDADGSLATQNFVISGNGNNIDGFPTYTMTNTKNGPKAAIVMRFSAAIPEWLIV
jgi:hypothetical protein